MAMDPALPITALVLASATEASKACPTTLARGLLRLSPMVLLLLCTTQSVLPGTLDLLPAMLVALSLVIQVSIMAKGLLMPMLMPMPMLMLTMVCMDMEAMDTGIQVAIPMSLVLPTTVLMLMALAHTGAEL